MQALIQTAVYFGLGLIFIAYYGVTRHSKKGLVKIPFGLLILFFFLKGLVPVFNYAGIVSTADSLNIAADITVWMAAFRIIVYVVVDYFLRIKKGFNIPTITRDFGLAIVYIIIAMIVLKHKTNINLGSLLTTSAILTAVVGFAMQDTLGNLFSGLALQLEHPYQIDDWIGFEGIVGKVVGITWKSTKILTRSEELIFVPNNTIAKSTLTNFSRPTPHHVVSIEIGVDYNEPPNKLKKALVEAVLDHPKVIADPPPSARVVKFDNSSVNYKVFFWTNDIANEEKTRHEILGNVWYVFKRRGIKIPYPILEEIHVDKEVLDRAEAGRKSAEAAETVAFLKEVEGFRLLSDAAISDMSGRIALLLYAPGETIVRQGDGTGPMYIIKDGDCSVCVAHAGEEPKEVAVLKKAQFFGEMSVLTGAPRTATVKAKTDVQCYEIEKEDIARIFASHPEMLEKMGHFLAARSAALSTYKEKTEDALKHARDSEGQLLSKIKSFLGL